LKVDVQEILANAHETRESL